MPKYKYIVINPENKQLEGVIGAPDEASAKNELNELGFSVIAMNQIAEEEMATSVAEMPVFEFGAIDKNQKHVIGTIQAAERYSAYKRLISEYSFQVEYVIDNNLTEEQKIIERQKGALDLQDMMNEEGMLTQKKMTNEEKDLKEFMGKQEVLKLQIDFVLNKVREMLDLYEKDMKQETKAKIHYFVDKLLRIRSSTNLDYVRKTAEELLLFLQQEELFLNEQAHLKDRTKMLIEAKSMTMQLKRSKTKNSISFTDSMRQWRQVHIFDNPAPSGGDRLLSLLAGIFIGPIKETDEILGIRRDIVTVNSQIWQYVQLYIQATTPEVKAETKEGLKRLMNERKKQKIKLRKAVALFHKSRKALGEETFLQKFAKEIYSFSGWLLVFYLIYYFAAIYITSKNFGIAQVPNYFYIFRSSFLKYFLALLFLLHSALGIKFVFLKKNEFAVFIISPIVIFASILILLNF
jgi:hypothetical protein